MSFMIWPALVTVVVALMRLGGADIICIVIFKKKKKRKLSWKLSFHKNINLLFLLLMKERLNNL